MKTDFLEIRQKMEQKARESNARIMNMQDGMSYTWFKLDTDIGRPIDRQLAMTVGHTFKTTLTQKPSETIGFIPTTTIDFYTKVFDEDGERGSGLFV